MSRTFPMKHEFRGQKLTICEISEITGLDVSTLRTRLGDGLPLDRPYGREPTLVEFCGERLTRKEIASRVGINPSTVGDRLRRGKPLTDRRYQIRKHL